MTGNFAGRSAGFASGVRDREGPTVEAPASCSDNASNCFIICAFSHFWAFLGLVAYFLASMATSARAVTIPMPRMLIIDACFLGVCGQAGSRQIVPFLHRADVGHRGCCPHLAFAVYSFLMVHDRPSYLSWIGGAKWVGPLASDLLPCPQIDRPARFSCAGRPVHCLGLTKRRPL